MHLLARRGFAQHDRLSVLGEVLPLPALDSLSDDGAFGHQRDDGTKPFGPDLDGRTGYAWRARYGDPHRFRVLATVSDNRGDRGLHRGEYAWRTRYALLGEWQPGEHWTLAGEWIDGDSGMGLRTGPHVDPDFSAAYLLASWAPADDWRWSARIEALRDHRSRWRRRGQQRRRTYADAVAPARIRRQLACGPGMVAWRQVSMLLPQ